MKKRILACLLALVMLIGAMPVMALAAEPEAENWEVSKSKTATALDADGSTRVTLSLPSAEETLASDVVFVLDTSRLRRRSYGAGFRTGRPAGNCTGKEQCRHQGWRGCF